MNISHALGYNLNQYPKNVIQSDGKTCISENSLMAEKATVRIAVCLLFLLHKHLEASGAVSDSGGEVATY